MRSLLIEGVGQFQLRNGCWECSPQLMFDPTLNIDGEDISPGQQERARQICRDWSDIIIRCKAYIEEVRDKYKLQAFEFNEPGVFIGEADEWSVYFDTEHEFDAVVGVEFHGELPCQLTIGD